MRAYLFILCIMLAGLTAKAQLIDDSISVEGNYRSFHFEKPQTKSKASLVFVLHGSGGNGKGIMRVTEKLEAIAAKENILIVYPDGYKRFWNECRKMAATPPNEEDINEEAFLLG